MTNKYLPLTPGSVIQSDSLLMRTRWGNWVVDGGFIVETSDFENEEFIILFDADPDADNDRR